MWAEPAGKADSTGMQACPQESGFSRTEWEGWEGGACIQYVPSHGNSMPVQGPHLENRCSVALPPDMASGASPTCPAQCY